MSLSPFSFLTDVSSIFSFESQEKHNLKRFATTNSEKIKCATRILNQVCSEYPEVRALETLLEALTELAYHNQDDDEMLSSRRSGKKQSGSSTRSLNSSRGGKAKYSAKNCVKFRRLMDLYRAGAEKAVLLKKNDGRILDVEDSYTITATGLNAPKVLSLRMNTGSSKRVLLKGFDDLRQDAVMQQLFQFVADLGLAIRTYRVIPLTPAAGLIEWVENTIGIGSYLVDGSQAAHKRYREPEKNHLEPRQCLGAILEVRKDGNQALIKKFKEICAAFPPVFRYFFLERFSVPAEWYLRRKVYTESVAVNSMVGHIFGVGDRHLQNILVDVKTAEVVHIDFGVTFEAGKTLATPERVPFRLTRDMTDPMPNKSADGSFLTMCEHAMQTLRDNAEVITTICDVFVHDPIYSWTVNVRSQDCEQQPRQQNRVAQNVLQRIKQKLIGNEDTHGEILNVKGQVRRLVQQATDAENLALMYAGWAPWA